MDCARLSSRDTISSEPRLVVEVISLSNDWIETRKLQEDYQAHAEAAHILFVRSLKTGAQLWTRTDTGWTERVVEDLEGVFALPAIEAQLSMVEIYQDFDDDEQG